MTIRFHVTELQPEQFQFGFSPAQEVLHSLHVLLNSEKHPLHIQWEFQTRRRMDKSLRGLVDAFSFLYQDSMAVFWLSRNRRYNHNFDEELEEFLNMPISTYQSQVVNVILRRRPSEPSVSEQMEGISGDVETLLWDVINSRFPHSRTELEWFLKDPTESRLRFADFLKQYWVTCIQGDWFNYEQWFTADIETRVTTLYRHGPLETFRGLSPDVLVDDIRGVVLLLRRDDGDIYFMSDQPILLVPSYFNWPKTYCDPSVPLLTYPIVNMQRAGSRPLAPEELVKLLRAAGDKTRIEIIQMLKREKRSTKELALLMGISESAVSKHLKLLQDANFLATERSGYFVYYKLKERPFEDLILGLSQLLE